MEKEQCCDSYIPFVKTELIKASELLGYFSESAGKFCLPDETQRALKFIFCEILPIAENFTDGQIFSLLDGKKDYSLSQKWYSILNYLTEKKLIAALHRAPLYCDEPKIIRLIFSPAFDFDERLTDGRIPLRGYTHGDALEFDEAISKTIGELLERFPLLIYREKNLLRASLADLKRKGRPHLNLDSLAGFSEEQKENNPMFCFNKDDHFLWLEGKSLFDKKTYLIPAQLIFWNYRTAHQNWTEPFLREQNTNGAGGYFTRAAAILSGLYELIQRDGFLIYWLNGKAPPQIDLDAIDYEPLKNLIEEFRHLDLDVRFYNTTADLGIPSCICTIFDHSGVGPKVSMGGGCGMNWDEMLLRALAEASGVNHWTRKRFESQEKKQKGILSFGEDYKPFSDDNFGQVERINLWADGKNFKHFEFFLKGKRQSLKKLKEDSKEFSSPEEELDYLAEKFKALGEGFEIFYYEAKHEALKDLGYFSVRVIVPALIPLYLRETFATLNAKRLKEVPEKLGFQSAEKWNHFPHPFP